MSKTVYTTTTDKMRNLLSTLTLRESKRVTVKCECGTENKHNLEFQVVNAINTEDVECGSCGETTQIQYFHTNLFVY